MFWLVNSVACQASFHPSAISLACINHPTLHYLLALDQLFQAATTTIRTRTKLAIPPRERLKYDWFGVLDPTVSRHLRALPYRPCFGRSQSVVLLEHVNNLAVDVEITTS